jgi:hypothetical protein
MITNPPTSQNWGKQKNLCGGDHDGNPAIIAKEVISTHGLKFLYFFQILVGLGETRPILVLGFSILVFMFNNNIRSKFIFNGYEDQYLT